jgi:hypothetical protein
VKQGSKEFRSGRNHLEKKGSDDEKKSNYALPWSISIELSEDP